ncbi:MAG: hypothetical protein LBL66_01960 [Clostridiales bacterium]|jgi:Na+(H+)/acetate symporter ActP|nr:hypothetical protein [Clostridiales bacterium]
MQQKPKRIIAIIALAFVLIATVCFIPYLILHNMSGAAGAAGAVLGSITLTTFLIGGGLWGFITAVNNRDLKAEKLRKETAEDLKVGAEKEPKDESKIEN